MRSHTQKKVLKSVLVNFPVAITKCSKRGHAREKRCILVHISRAQPIVKSRHQELEAVDRVTFTIRKLRVMDA